MIDLEAIEKDLSFADRYPVSMSPVLASHVKNLVVEIRRLHKGISDCLAGFMLGDGVSWIHLEHVLKGGKSCIPLEEDLLLIVAENDKISKENMMLKKAIQFHREGTLKATSHVSNLDEQLWEVLDNSDNNI